MRKILLCTVCLLLVTFVSAQNENEVTWFGIDFSKAKFVGSAGFSDPSKIQSYYLNEWNSIIVNEKEKYSISKYYVKPTVNVNLDIVKERNNKVVASTLVTDNTFSLPQADAEAVVKKYKGKGAGQGLVFVVETFSKTTEEASVYVALFDISTGKITSIKKQTGKPSGFGFRNYWLGAIMQVMKKGL